jgi:GNAT superfamily N-acetyltransferase
MAVVELNDRARVEALTADSPMALLEARDESARGIDGIVSVFCADEADPADKIVVRWAQASLGLRSVAHVRARTLSGLAEVVAAVPSESQEYDALVPFWAAPALGTAFQSEVNGAAAVYEIARGQLRSSPAARQAQRVDEPRLLQPIFRKLVEDAPAYALSVHGQLAAVAAVTHLREGLARVAVYVVEEHRRRGFGRGVLAAVTDELLALGLIPTASLSLADEASVRLIEGAGFRQHEAMLSVRLRRPGALGGGGGLVQLGRS